MFTEKSDSDKKNNSGSNSNSNDTFAMDDNNNNNNNNKNRSSTGKRRTNHIMEEEEEEEENSCSSDDERDPPTRRTAAGATTSRRIQYVPRNPNQFRRKRLIARKEILNKNVAKAKAAAVVTTTTPSSSKKKKKESTKSTTTPTTNTTTTIKKGTRATTITTPTTTSATTTRRRTRATTRATTKTSNDDDDAATTNTTTTTAVVVTPPPEKIVAVSSSSSSSSSAGVVSHHHHLPASTTAASKATAATTREKDHDDEDDEEEETTPTTTPTTTTTSRKTHDDKSEKEELAEQIPLSALLLFPEKYEDDEERLGKRRKSSSLSDDDDDDDDLSGDDDDDDDDDENDTDTDNDTDDDDDDDDEEEEQEKRSSSNVYHKTLSFLFDSYHEEDLEEEEEYLEETDDEYEKYYEDEGNVVVVIGNNNNNNNSNSNKNNNRKNQKKEEEEEENASTKNSSFVADPGSEEEEQEQEEKDHDDDDATADPTTTIPTKTKTDVANTKDDTSTSTTSSDNNSDDTDDDQQEYELLVANLQEARKQQQRKSDDNRQRRQQQHVLFWEKGIMDDANDDSSSDTSKDDDDDEWQPGPSFVSDTNRKDGSNLRKSNRIALLEKNNDDETKIAKPSRRRNAVSTAAGAATANNNNKPNQGTVSRTDINTKEQWREWVPNLGWCFVSEKKAVELDPKKETHTIEDRLMTAARENDQDVLQSLLTTTSKRSEKHNNNSNSNSNTFSDEVLAKALHVAITNGHVNAVKILWLDGYANRRQHPPREPTTTKCKKDGTKLAISRPDLSPLHAAVSCSSNNNRHRNDGGIKMLKLFLDDFNLDPNDLDENQNTALVVACSNNNLKAMKFLLKYGADPMKGCFRLPPPPLTTTATTTTTDDEEQKNITSRKWQECGALYAALEKGLVGAASILLEHGVNPEEGMFQEDIFAKEDVNLLPLDMALVTANCKMLEVLLKHGATRFGVLKDDDNNEQPFLFLMRSSEESRGHAVIQYLGDLAARRDSEAPGARVAAGYIDKCFRLAIQFMQQHKTEHVHNFYLDVCFKLVEAGANPKVNFGGVSAFDCLLRSITIRTEEDIPTSLLDLTVLFSQYSEAPMKKIGMLLQISFKKRRSVFDWFLNEWMADHPNGRSRTQDTLLRIVCRLPVFNDNLVAAVLDHYAKVLPSADSDWAFVDCLNAIDLDTTFNVARQNVDKLLRVHLEYGKRVFEESEKQIAERCERLHTRQRQQRALRKRRREERAKATDFAEEVCKDCSVEEEEACPPSRKQPSRRAKSSSASRIKELAKTKENSFSMPTENLSIRDPARDQSASKSVVSRPPGKMKGEEEKSCRETGVPINRTTQKLDVDKPPANTKVREEEPSSTGPTTRSKKAGVSKQYATRKDQAEQSSPITSVSTQTDNNIADGGKCTSGQSTGLGRRVTRAQGRQARGLSFDESDFSNGGPSGETQHSKRKRESSPGGRIVAAFHRLPNQRLATKATGSCDDNSSDSIDENNAKKQRTPGARRSTRSSTRLCASKAQPSSIGTSTISLVTSNGIEKKESIVAHEMKLRKQAIAATVASMNAANTCSARKEPVSGKTPVASLNHKTKRKTPRWLAADRSAFARKISKKSKNPEFRIPPAKERVQQQATGASKKPAKKQTTKTKKSRYGRTVP